FTAKTQQGRKELGASFDAKTGFKGRFRRKIGFTALRAPCVMMIIRAGQSLKNATSDPEHGTCKASSERRVPRYPGKDPGVHSACTACVPWRKLCWGDFSKRHSSIAIAFSLILRSPLPCPQGRGC